MDTTWRYIKMITNKGINGTIVSNVDAFDNCFICEESLEHNYWYHDDCRKGEDAIAAVEKLNFIPKHIPREQHYRYIRRYFLRGKHGKV